MPRNKSIANTGKILQQQRRRIGEYREQALRFLPVNSFKQLTPFQLFCLALLITGGMVAHTYIKREAKPTGTGLDLATIDMSTVPEVDMRDCFDYSDENSVTYCRSENESYYLKQYHLVQKGANIAHPIHENVMQRIDRFFPQLQERYKDSKTKEQLLAAHLVNTNQHNFALLRSVGIVCPRVKLVRFEKEVFLQSKELPDFTSAHGLYTRNEFKVLYQKMSGEPLPQIMVTYIRELCGEHELAKLIVACTFVDDLWRNPGNWGLVKHKDKYSLAVVDADMSLMQDERAAYRAIQRNFKTTVAELNFLSLNNIRTMRDLYRKMLAVYPPPISPAVDISRESYEKLLHSYIDACEQTLDAIHDEHLISNADKPSSIVGAMWLEHIKNLEEKLDSVAVPGL